MSDSLLCPPGLRVEDLVEDHHLPSQPLMPVLRAGCAPSRGADLVARGSTERGSFFSTRPVPHKRLPPLSGLPPRSSPDSLACSVAGLRSTSWHVDAWC